MNKNMIKSNIIVLLAFQFIVGQDYILKSPQVTGGQASLSSDLFNLSSNTATQSADPISSDSFSVLQGIMGVTQGLYALPPVVNAFIADTIY